MYDKYTGIVVVVYFFVYFVIIQGIEDYCGDMDFKMVGIRNGIIVIQVNIICSFKV